jgi:hypothetical protein
MPLPFSLGTFAENLFAGWVSASFGPESMIGWTIALGFAVYFAINWHRRQRAAKKPGMGSLSFIIICFAVALVAVAGGAYGLGQKFGQGTTKPTETTQVLKKDEYLNNPALTIGTDDQMPLALGGTSAITTVRLRVFVDYASHRSGWMSRVRAPIGEIKDPVKGQYVRIQLIYRATRPNGGTNQLWWGDNSNFHPVNGPESNPIWPVAATRGRVVIVGPTASEQYIYFELMRANPDPGKYEFSLFQGRDVGDWIAQWEADS